jgi:poly-gamma-glutamate capsule biosynthesis protein CapA/YwtB (metallophosphatase superfamily)
MTRSRIIAISIGIFFVLLAALGVARRAQSPEFPPEVRTGASSNSTLEDFFRTAKTIAPESHETTVRFTAVGDIMLSRNVAGTIAKANDPLLPFRKMESYLSSADFNFGNLESPISGRNDFNPSGSLVFNAPTSYTQGLMDYKFKIINLANNHALDQGENGLSYTRKFLESLGITHIGTGGTLDEAWQGKTITINGVSIGFIGASYSSVNDGGKATNDFVARIEDLNRLKQSVTALKTQSDFVVVTMHAGTEYTHTPNQGQIDFARAAIDAGADMVIGAHPHWVQTIEQYNGKYIFYSLGNFIFDQEWSQDTKEGLALSITLSSTKKKNPTIPQAATSDDLQGTRIGATLKEITLIPVIIENYSTPRPANEAEAAKILQKINQPDTTLFP